MVVHVCYLQQFLLISLCSLCCVMLMSWTHIMSVIHICFAASIKCIWWFINGTTLCTEMLYLFVQAVCLSFHFQDCSLLCLKFMSCTSYAAHYHISLGLCIYGCCMVHMLASFGLVASCSIISECYFCSKPYGRQCGVYLVELCLFISRS